MRNRPLFLLAALFLASLVAAGVFAQEVPETPEAPESAPAAEPADNPESAPDPEMTAAPSLLFETTLNFEMLNKKTLEGQVGEVEIRAVEFGSKGSKGGLFGTKDADLKASISTQLDCSTTAEKKWKVEFTIEFLDGEGNLIDRAEGGGSLKAESKVIEINHTTLKFVVSQIKKVRISAVGKGKK